MATAAEQGKRHVAAKAEDVTGHVTDKAEGAKDHLTEVGEALCRQGGALLQQSDSAARAVAERPKLLLMTLRPVHGFRPMLRRLRYRHHP